jgi:hypothetical protein
MNTDEHQETDQPKLRQLEIHILLKRVPDVNPDGNGLP